MAQGQDLDGQLAARSEEGQRRVEEGVDDVQHGSGPWPGRGQTSTISRWSRFLGGVRGTSLSWTVRPPHSRITAIKAGKAELLWRLKDNANPTVVGRAWFPDDHK